MKHYFIWTPKYRKELLISEVAEAKREKIEAIAGAYGMEIDALEVMEDQVHVFISSPPRNSPARRMQIPKSVSARDLFALFPWLY
jgi:putative transposase